MNPLINTAVGILAIPIIAVGLLISAMICMALMPVQGQRREYDV